MTPLERVEAAIVIVAKLQAMGKQLEILTAIANLLYDAADRIRVEQNQRGIPLHYRHVLALADAILGDTP